MDAKHDSICLNEITQSPRCKSQKEQEQRTSTRRRAYTTYREEEAPVARPRRGSLSNIPVLTPAEELPKIKVVIIGDSAVGKSYIYKNYDKGGVNLTGSSQSEISIIDFMNKNVRLGRHNFILQMWDTAGEERFGAFMPSWLRNAKVVICVYDVTDKLSYQAIPKHVEIAKQYADPRAIFFLVGNKVDLEHRREVQEADGEILAAQHNMTFMECSGLTGYNITNLFESITKHVVSGSEDKFTSSGPPLRKESIIELNSNNRVDRPQDKKCSCLGFQM